MGNLSRKAALGVAAALTAATTATVTGGVAGAATATITAPAPRAVVAALAAPAAPAGPAVMAAPDCLMAGLTWPLTQRGATGERVYSIQQFLNQRIGAGLAADGNFGPLTEAAVIRFQASAGLARDGKVGQETWPRLCIPVSRGATGPAVFALQHNLHFAYGFSDLNIDGIFGPMTEQAVRIFQMVERIVVDGIVGPVTWNRIISHEM
jgi:peptidoglycan hydrolase-like protein with peptidoglycan-binding domain